MNKEELLTARLVNAAMKRYDAQKEALSTRGDAEKNTIARAKLKAAEQNLNQACENYSKSGGQP
jgi:hypothetical protein